MGEQRFREVVESVPQYVWTCDAHGACDFACERWLAYTGGSEATLLGDGWLARIHPDERRAVEARWRRSLQTGESFAVEQRLARADGTYRWFDSRALPVRNADERIVRWVGTHSDIQESRELREALGRERARMDKLLATLPGVVHTFRRDPSGAISFPFASPPVESLYGLSAAELASDGTLLIDLIHPDDRPRVLASLDVSAATMRPWTCEYRVRTPKGGELWIEGHSIPERDGDGSITWSGFLHDVTERKRAQEELEATKAKLVSALEAADLGTWAWTIGTSEVSWDEGCVRICGRQPSDPWVSEDVLGLIHPEDRERVAAEVESAIRECSVFSVEYRVLHARGDWVWVAARGRIECDRERRPVRLTGVLMNVHQQKVQAEARVRTQKLEALGTLAGGIAHDFNNVLFAIQGNGELALASFGAEHRARRFVSDIVAASSRAAALVRQILTFSRPQDARREVFELGPVVEEALQLMRATLPAMIALRFECDPDTPRVVADATRVHQTVVNLATNAAQAIGRTRSGLIEVRTRPVQVGSDRDARVEGLLPGPYAELSVRDDGCGMGEALMARVFDPFFTTKPPGEGTGLGLSVVHGIMRGLGGAITVESQVACGTTFRLYFPAARQGSTRPPPSRARDRSGTGERVLYLDDDEMLVTLGSNILELLGYRAFGFSSPSEALSAFRADPSGFDAVVTDLSMPAMSGFDFTRVVLAARPEVPVIVMSGYLGPDERATAARLGVRTLLNKPVAMDRLAHALRAALSARRV